MQTQWLKKFLHYNALMAWRTRDFWLRAVLCWVIGAVLLLSDEASNIDMRLRVRGPRPSQAPLVLVDLNERDWAALDPESRNVLRPLKEIITLSDSYFWNTRIWSKLLARILAEQPSAVGITSYFGENIRGLRPTLQAPEEVEVFQDPRVIWSADIDNSGRLLLPIFAIDFNANVGLRGIHTDPDGTVRRFSNSSVQVPTLPVRLAEIARPSLAASAERLNLRLNDWLIDYSGDSSSFEVVSAKEVLEGHLPHGVFQNKVVLIGSLGSTGEEMQTPLGRMSRTEILANMTENILAQKIIKRLPTSVYLLLLGLIMAGSIWLLLSYPQSVTLVILILTGMVWSALSVWAFDVYCVWLPVVSPLAQLTVTCIVYLSYQLAVNERRTWRLEEEQRYLNQIEQLKTNFVSMMSHDLKTPIAKIQAICDRLIKSHEADTRLTQDLKTLRRSSDELHRYIQSILQVTKVEAKEFRIQKEVTDINDHIERVVQRLRPLAIEKGLEIETELEPLFSIEVDSSLIQEVIHNLIENAIKYTPAPADSKPSSLSRVRVTSQEMDDKVVVVVEDTGPGIDPEDQKTIWLKFTRGRNLLVGGSDVRGTGLGLYLVKYFVELHGGEVFLESELKKGTRIGFSIPISAPRDDIEM